MSLAVLAQPLITTHNTYEQGLCPMLLIDYAIHFISYLLSNYYPESAKDLR